MWSYFTHILSMLPRQVLPKAHLVLSGLGPEESASAFKGAKVFGNGKQMA